MSIEYHTYHICIIDLRNKFIKNFNLHHRPAERWVREKVGDRDLKTHSYREEGTGTIYS